VFSALLVFVGGTAVTRQRPTATADRFGVTRVPAITPSSSGRLRHIVFSLSDKLRKVPTSASCRTELVGQSRSPGTGL